jgi:transcriptional regulator with XRE-family HTH domain
MALALKFVMCEQPSMERTPGTMELAEKAGISKSYASEIVNGKRPPSRSLAIHIFRATEWRHDSIADLTENQMAVLEAVDPWSPRSTQAEQAAAA